MKNKNNNPEGQYSEDEKLKVFISHGHNEDVKQKIKNFIAKSLKHDPIILGEQLERHGLTIIEALEKLSEGCQFAVGLLTGDDLTESGALRARQNVVHEVGFFMGRLGRSKVVLIVNKGVEIPSNLSGLFFLEYVNDIEETFPDLRVILNARDAFVSAKLYDARHQRVLKKGYRVKYVSVHQPGHDAKYVPVYLSPAGDEVFEDEATFEEIAIFAVPDTAPSRSDREFAIDKISRIFKDKSDAKVDCSQLEHAIEAMALEDDLTLKVGQQLAERLSSENPNDEFAVRLLVKSGLKDAIAPLTKLLVYEASYDHRCCEDSVHRLALETLRKFVADKPEFRYEAARAALALFARWREGYYRDLVKTWAVELLDGLANSTSTERDWAREQLKELEVA